MPVPDPALLHFDPAGRVVAATEAARALVDYDPEAGRIGGASHTATAAVVRRVLACEADEAGVQVDGPDGTPVWIALRRDPEDPRRAVGHVRRGRRVLSPDDDAQSDRLRLLATVTAHGASPFRDRLRRALALTSELLGLELGLASQIEGETYTVFAAHTPDGALAPGDTFALGDTFCSITIDGPDVLAINGVEGSPYRAHPCYRVFGLESYVGVPVVVRGAPWGTLTFSSATALPVPLGNADLDLVRLLALWVGGEIEREDDRRALAESADRYHALSRATFEGIAFSQGGVVMDCNDQFVQLFGFESVEDAVGRSASEFVTPESAETVARMIRDDRSDPYEARLRRRDGATFWAEIQGRTLSVGGERRRVTAIRDVSPRRALSDQLAHQATHDALTGLPNRSFFQARVEQALAAGGPFAVLFVDLDQFKVVNDSLGHETGDLLLATIAERLRSALGGVEGATVARLGGDEFGVVAPIAGPGLAASGQAVGAAVLEALRLPVDLGPREHAPGASIGVVEGAQAYATPEEVVRDADTAMYEAKRAGRGRVAVFDEAMHAAATDRFRLEHELRQALAGDELRVFLQPVVRLETGATVGFEALVRWAHPERGLLTPGAFVPFAEEIGLVDEIDSWVLNATAQALRDGLRGQAAAEALLWLSLNCSDVSFLSGALGERVRAAVAETGLAPSQFIIELTERAVVDPADARRALEALHAQGVQVCVDDFGTGFSSLGLLHALPVDGLKIDRSFVKDLGRSATARAVVRAIVGMAADLGLRVVAEGVETAEQRAALLALGCEYAQGYLFAHPHPAAEALAQLGPAGPPATAGQPPT